MIGLVESRRIPGGYPQWGVIDWRLTGRLVDLENERDALRAATARLVIDNSHVYGWNRVVRRWATKHNRA